ncbi:MAG TPA: extracellular solute-binding protein [Anaerolineales bacterium]|nr:extracellular solute-binding protein [Anaerolineales bacterium]
MTTIEFTAIPDTDEDYNLQLELLTAFKKQTGIEVKLTRLDWSNAWQVLINISTHGQGADISHVGSTWVSSLVSMNALRPIPPHLITHIGSEESFVHSAWQSALMENDKHAWAIPLSTYTYAVAYRRDLLELAGLNGATAFATPFAFEATIGKLEELNCAEHAWLMPYVPFPFNDFVHTAASWIWSSGGHLMDNRGKTVLFDSPATLAGLKAYFNLVRRLPDAEYLGTDQCMQLLMQGRAAAVLTDVRAILTELQEDSPDAQNIGAASVMSIPWSGGGNLVIWRHTYGYPDQLEATFKLAEYLTRKSTMLEVGRRSHILPARVDALDELIPAEHPLRPVMLQLVSSSRTYRSIPLWRRIENQLGQELSTIAKMIIENEEADMDKALAEVMGPLSHRLNLTLE